MLGRTKTFFGEKSEDVLVHSAEFRLGAVPERSYNNIVGIQVKADKDVLKTTAGHHRESPCEVSGEKILLAQNSSNKAS